MTSAPVTLVIPIFPYPPTGDSRLSISDLDLLLYWWGLVELAERIWEYLASEQYSRRGENVDEWDALAIAKRTCELAYRGLGRPWELAFSEFYGKHPSKLVPYFARCDAAWQGASLPDFFAVLIGREPKSNLIDFPVSPTRATERAADLNSQPSSSGKKAA